MVLHTDELARISDEVYRDRRIGHSLYCGNCGYCLLTLPYVHECPECGNRYNARPLAMKGIFLPHVAVFPGKDLFAMLVSAASVSLLGYYAYTSKDASALAFAGLFLALTVGYGWVATVRALRFFKSLSIIRRIEAEERD